MARLCQAWFRSGDINPMAIRQKKTSKHLQKKGGFHPYMAQICLNSLAFLHTIVPKVTQTKCGT